MNQSITNEVSGAAREGRSRRMVLPALVVLGAMAGITQTARADAYNFSFSGSGITASGHLDVSSTPDAAGFLITGIGGTFTDSNNLVGGTITGLEAAPVVTVFNVGPPAGTFGAPAFTSAGFSYDNIFYPGGDSPAVCIDALAFFGGDLDIYGIVFDLSDGATVDLWSQGMLGGYFVGDSFNGVRLGDSDNGYPVNFTATTPEPGSLLLLGTGLPGVLALLKRKTRRVR